jgi:hypothetical protein
MSSQPRHATFLIVPPKPKSLNPNWEFTASYDQTLYEKTIPPLHVLARAVWHLVSAGSNRHSDCEPDGSDGSDSRDSRSLISNTSVNNDASINRNTGNEADL